MIHTLRLKLCLPIVILLAACGARPGMEPSLSDSGLAPDAALPLPDALLPEPDASSPEPDAAVLPPCEWVPGEVFQLTLPPHDKGLHTVAVTDRGALVAWQITNSPSDNVRQLQPVTWLGEPAGPLEALFPAPGDYNSYGGIRLATGPDHFGATVWDEANGCRFRPIDAQGNALGTPHRVADHNCGSLRSTPGGFSLITRSYSAIPATLVRLDAQGQRVLESDPIPVLDGEVFWYATVMLQSGDYVVAGMREGVGPREIRTQRIDPDGVPLTDPVTIATPGVEIHRVRLIQAGNALLIGWLEDEETAPHYQHQRIVLQPLDLDGHVAGPVVRLPDRYAYRDSGWSLARVDDQILVTFMHPLEEDYSGDLSAVMVQPVTFAGQPDGPAVELARDRFIRHTMIRETPRGAIIVFQANPDGLPHQIFAGALLCVRPD